MTTIATTSVHSTQGELWITWVRLREVIGKEMNKPVMASPASVDNLFLQIWSDHDTACDETRWL
ncbi:hypothetical protein EXO26_09920 [Salmonella enterica]|nr:hypothetical protein [Salmonella enterica]